MSYHRFHCPITDDCDGIVLVELGSFESTTATVSLCPVCQSKMIEAAYFVSYDISKSAVFGMDQEGTRSTPIRHVDGLLTFV